MRAMERPAVISDRDAAMVIGVLAVLSGPLLAENLDEALAGQLRNWLAGQGLLPSDVSQRDLSFALQEVVDRLRHARGEYDGT